MAHRMNAVVSCKWLAQCLASKPRSQPLRILDGSLYLSKEKRNPKAEYIDCHIPGAMFFDIVACSDKSTGLDYMLPSPAEFQTYVGEELGICNDTHVVIYDNHSLYRFFSAPRVWWMFRTFGHSSVSVLNGGLREWKAQGGAVSNEKETVKPTGFVAAYDGKLLKTFKDVEENLLSRSSQVVDTRSPKRFNGTSLDYGKSGRIPESRNIPYHRILDKKSSFTKRELLDLFEEAKVELQKPITATCGKGLTACILALAAYECGKDDVAVYDGSWQEWLEKADPQQKTAVPGTVTSVD